MRNLQKNLNIIWQPSPFLDKSPLPPFCLTPLFQQKISDPPPFTSILKRSIPPPPNYETVTSWSSRKKKEGIFCTVYFLQMEFFKICFISMYSVLNTLSEYTYFYISKNITLYTFVACF